MFAMCIYSNGIEQIVLILLLRLLIISLYFVVVVTVRGRKPGVSVNLTDAEVRGLCIKSREVFLSQPILLELSAPLKICGKF